KHVSLENIERNLMKGRKLREIGAQSVRLITGHLKTGGELDWENLAAEKQTLAISQLCLSAKFNKTCW
ncbi:hypothetical protein O5853_32520, partial [Escherichia coli]|nr:hypothetical protein [Escherichia coli]